MLKIFARLTAIQCLPECKFSRCANGRLNFLWLQSVVCGPHNVITTYWGPTQKGLLATPWKGPNIRQTLARFTVIPSIGCVGSNSIIYMKCVSTPILHSHIKQYGHHRVAMLMEIGTVLNEVFLYERIQLYILVLQERFKSLFHKTRRSNHIQEYYPHSIVTVIRHQNWNLHIKWVIIGRVTTACL